MEFLKTISKSTTFENISIYNRVYVIRNHSTITLKAYNILTDELIKTVQLSENDEIINFYKSHEKIHIKTDYKLLVFDLNTLDTKYMMSKTLFDYAYDYMLNGKKLMLYNEHNAYIVTDDGIVMIDKKGTPMYTSKNNDHIYSKINSYYFSTYNEIKGTAVFKINELGKSIEFVTLISPYVSSNKLNILGANSHYVIFSISDDDSIYVWSNKQNKILDNLYGIYKGSCAIYSDKQSLMLYTYTMFNKNITRFMFDLSNDAIIDVSDKIRSFNSDNFHSIIINDDLKLLRVDIRNHCDLYKI